MLHCCLLRHFLFEILTSMRWRWIVKFRSSLKNCMYVSYVMEVLMGTAVMWRPLLSSGLELALVAFYQPRSPPWHVLPAPPLWLSLSSQCLLQDPPHRPGLAQCVYWSSCTFLLQALLCVFCWEPVPCLCNPDSGLASVTPCGGLQSYCLCFFLWVWP